MITAQEKQALAEILNNSIQLHYPNKTWALALVVMDMPHVPTRERGPMMVRLLNDIGLEYEYHPDTSCLVGNVPEPLRRELLFFDAISFADEGERRPRGERDHDAPIWRLDRNVAKLLKYLESNPLEREAYVAYLRTQLQGVTVG